MVERKRLLSPAAQKPEDGVEATAAAYPIPPGGIEVLGPLDRLVERVKDDVGVAFEDPVLDAVGTLPEPDYQRLRASLRDLGRGFPLSDWCKLAEPRRRRPSSVADGPAQGRALSISSPEPWEIEVGSGAELLDDIADFIGRHVILRPGLADAIALWVVHTHVYDLFRVTPRLFVTSPEARCGKTTLLDVVMLLVARAVMAANISTAALYRTVEIAKPTMVVDEADRFVDRNPELIGIANAGHRRGGSVIRCVGEDSEPAEFQVFAPLAIAAIRQIADTLVDRSVIIKLARALHSEKPEPIDQAVEDLGRQLARKIARWTGDQRDELANVTPGLPDHLYNRAADNWRPLFAIAQVAGGNWPERVVAAERATAAEDDDDERLTTLLLRSLKMVFDRERDPSRVLFSSLKLVEELCLMEDMPWADMPKSHKPITTRELWRMLKAFGARPRQAIDENGRNKQHLRARDLDDAFTRYLSSGATPEKAPKAPVSPNPLKDGAPARANPLTIQGQRAELSPRAQGQIQGRASNRVRVLGDTEGSGNVSEPLSGKEKVRLSDDEEVADIKSAYKHHRAASSSYPKPSPSPDVRSTHVNGYAGHGDD